LEDASLRDPERIDVMARRMGLVPPEPGQVIRMDGASGGWQRRPSDGECGCSDGAGGTVAV